MNTSTCCSNLYSALGAKVSFPGSTTYTSSLVSYFSQQQSTTVPNCIVAPVSTADVSSAVKVITVTPSCQFAIRSGGHTLNKNASNIDGGVTIDLRSLNFVNLSSDKSTVAVGPGAVWGDVYSVLDPLDLTVAGGRAAGVGVGGLTLGGGISYLSPRVGFTTDTVTNFEVVLADGSVVNANENENYDLMVALRGGSNNFGVVTKIDYEVFELGMMLGGAIMHPISVIPDQITEFVKINSAKYDEYASLINNWVWTAQTGQIAVSQPVYTKAEASPDVYQGLLSLPALQSSIRVTKMSDLAAELDASAYDGLRGVYVVATVKSSEKMLQAIHKHWNASIPCVESVLGLSWVISNQPLPPAIYKRHADSNSLGLGGETGNLAIILLSASWALPTDDTLMFKSANGLLKKIEEEARSLNAWVEYKYLNYAGPEQNPIAHYGTKSAANLRKVRDKYDPKKVFTNLVPGGFKLA